jgi:hypothetical protein
MQGIASSFPVTYVDRKNLGRAAVDFPLTLENLEWKIDTLCSQVAILTKDSVEKTQIIERLVVANQRLADTLNKLFGFESYQAQGND